MCSTVTSLAAYVGISITPDLNGKFPVQTTHLALEQKVNSEGSDSEDFLTSRELLILMSGTGKGIRWQL